MAGIKPATIEAPASSSSLHWEDTSSCLKEQVGLNVRCLVSICLSVCPNNGLPRLLLKVLRVQDDLEFLIFLLHLLLALQADVMTSDSQEKKFFFKCRKSNSHELKHFKHLSQ